MSEVETQRNPQAICPRCGKEYVLENVVTTGKPPLSMVCPECRSKMKKTTVTVITYEDGVREIHGECDFCGQIPCEHCPPNVTIVKESMIRDVLEPAIANSIIYKLYPRSSKVSEGIEKIVERTEEAVKHAEAFLEGQGFKIVREKKQK